MVKNGRVFENVPGYWINDAALKAWAIEFGEVFGSDDQLSSANSFIGHSTESTLEDLARARYLQSIIRIRTWNLAAHTQKHVGKVYEVDGTASYVAFQGASYGAYVNNALHCILRVERL